MIKGQPFSYEEEVLSHETITSITEDEGKKILETTKRLFNDVGMEPILAFGTLLGAIRDNGIIKGDEDVDVFCDDESKLLESLPYFDENGLKLIRVFSGVFYSFRLNDRCYIDVYIITEYKFNIWKLYCYKVYGRAMPKKYFKSYEYIDFLGSKYKVPANSENLLAFWYGDSWRIPVRGHKFVYEVKPAYYWRRFKEIVKSIIKFMIGWKYWKHLVKKIE